MKRYEFRIVAALVTLLLQLTMCAPRTISGAPYSPTTGTRGSGTPISGLRARQRQSSTVISDMQCTETKSYFFRSQCQDAGFLTVHRNKVLVQTTGLTTRHLEAEFVVELCSSRGSATKTQWRASSNSVVASAGPVIRYRHKLSNKYICFSKRGRVRVMTRAQVDRRGALCMFRQVAVDSTFHRLQSVHNRRWHLGFNHRPKALAAIKGREPHRAALPRNGRYFNPRKCDFKFYAGEHKPQEYVYPGGFDLIHTSTSNKFVSKAAKNSDIERGPIELGSSKDTATTSDRKISNAHKEALLQQQVLKQMKKRYQKKIRHWKHKRPRPSRKEKKGLRAFKRKQPMSKSHKI